MILLFAIVYPSFFFVCPLFFSAPYFWLAFVSRTAARKKMTTRGEVTARIMPVIRLPSSGSPDVSSKTEPIAAIAAMQEPARNTPLFGVTSNPIQRQYVYATGWTARTENPCLFNSWFNSKGFSTRSTNKTPLRWSISC